MTSAAATHDAPITAKRAQTRARLLDAARSVFAERGIQAASVEEICEAAGFTRGAFYSNFASKTELCVALLEHYAESAYAAAQQTLEDIRPQFPLDSVDNLVQRGVATFLALQERDWEWLLVVTELRLFAARDDDVREAYVQLDRDMNRLMGELLQPALDQLGCRLRVPLPRVLSLLEAVYEQGNIAAVVAGRGFSDDEMRHNLVLLMTGLVDAPTCGDQC